MGALSWITEHWFDLLQTLGIVGGLVFTAYTTHKDEKARRIGNMIAIAGQNQEIWKQVYERPKLFRALEKDVNLTKRPISDEEWLFVKLRILHLDTVYRAMKAGMFVKLEGLQKDIKEFFSAPIPSAVWTKIKPLQDAEFVRFIESCRIQN
jgi:phosphoribosylaminoimidazole-succinocarboxamide synthase